MYFIGYDIGSSFIKATLLDGNTGKAVANAVYPESEQPMSAKQAGWAEQDPEIWWEGIQQTTLNLLTESTVAKDAIGGIGISYQMHGLVIVDHEQQVLRPAIIWCDSRAVDIGRNAFEGIGAESCLEQLLNSPGNFTASKLRWVKENEPDVYSKIHKMMLPGDYIAMRLSGELGTTTTGLSEGILWNFANRDVAKILLDYYEVEEQLLPEIIPSFGKQASLSKDAAAVIGLKPGTPITYRAGDQPNNAFSLNVLNPGEIAATAGTSGVVYAVTDAVKFDPLSRINTFAHVNYTPEQPRLGVLLCLNGTGISNSWLRKQLPGNLSYAKMNALAETAPIGCDGLSFLPWGNGAERILQNASPGASFNGLSFNVHKDKHLARAVQEGVAYSFFYGMQIMQEIGLQPDVIRAGRANMFLSPVFRQTLADVTGVAIELYDTDGAQGAARAAAYGAGFYKSFKETFIGLQKLETVAPTLSNKQAQTESYSKWQALVNGEQYTHD
ncbi:MAG: xylulokinase [Calditrichia bacterium]